MLRIHSFLNHIPAPIQRGFNAITHRHVQIGILSLEVLGACFHLVQGIRTWIAKPIEPKLPDYIQTKLDNPPIDLEAERQKKLEEIQALINKNDNDVGAYRKAYTSTRQESHTPEFIALEDQIVTKLCEIDYHESLRNTIRDYCDRCDMDRSLELARKIDKSGIDEQHKKVILNSILDKANKITYNDFRNYLSLARCYHDLRKPQVRNHYLRMAQEQVTGEENPKLKCTWWTELAYTHHDFKLEEKMNECLEAANQSVVENPSSMDRVNHSLIMAQAHYKCGDDLTANDLIQAAVHHAEQDSSVENIFDTYLEIAKASNDPKEAGYILDKARDLLSTFSFATIERIFTLPNLPIDCEPGKPSKEHELSLQLYPWNKLASYYAEFASESEGLKFCLDKQMDLLKEYSSSLEQHVSAECYFWMALDMAGKFQNPQLADQCLISCNQLVDSIQDEYKKSKILVGMTSLMPRFGGSKEIYSQVATIVNTNISALKSDTNRFAFYLSLADLYHRFGDKNGAVAATLNAAKNTPEGIFDVIYRKLNDIDPQVAAKEYKNNANYNAERVRQTAIHNNLIAAVLWGAGVIVSSFRPLEGLVSSTTLSTLYDLMKR